MKLMYYEYQRQGKLIEDDWGLKIINNDCLSSSYDIQQGEQITDILTRWFKYIVSGSEGENRAEGCGWYFKFVIMISDNLQIDVTQTIIESEAYKQLYYEVDTYSRRVWNT